MPRRSRRGLVIGITAGVAVMLVLAGLGSYVLVSGFGEPSKPHAGKASASEQRAGALRDGGRLTTTIMDSGLLDSLMPAAIQATQGYSLLHALYTGLVRLDPKTSKPVNVIADKVSTTDAATWTIKIRKGWTFDNGEPVDAAAFIRSWSYAANGTNESPAAYQFSHIKGYSTLSAGGSSDATLSGLEAIDRYTVRVSLDEPNAWFGYALAEPAFMPMAKACQEDPSACKTAPIGDGPFRLEGSWGPNEDLTLTRNHSYHGAKAHLDSIVFKTLSDPEAGYAAFGRGEVGLLQSIPPSRYSSARARYGARLVRHPSLAAYYLGFPAQDKRFADKRVRVAFSKALDRKAVSAAAGAGASPLTSFVPPGVVGAPAEDSCGNCVSDPDKAKALLAETGWKTGAKITLYAPSSAERAPLETICRQLKRHLGVDCSLSTSMSASDFYPKLSAGTFDGPFRMAWLGDTPTADQYLGMFGGPAAVNFGYHNSSVDAAVSAGAEAASPAVAAKEYRSAWSTLNADMPAAPLWRTTDVALVGAGLGGVTLDPYGAVDLAAVGHLA